jgi:hypothetical protein
MFPGTENWLTLSGQNDFPGLFLESQHVYLNEKQFDSIYLHE